jgi:hypothetical protein
MAAKRPPAGEHGGTGALALLSARREAELIAVFVADEGAQLTTLAK